MNYSILDIVAVITPIVVFFVGAGWTISQHMIQQSYNKVRIYHEFQDRFKQFQSKLPDRINEKDPQTGKYCYEPPENEKDKFNRLLETYWWLVFDEWFVCCKECKWSCKSLWNNYYSKGVIDALQRENFKEALGRLLKLNNSFLGQDSNFAEDINQLYKKEYGVNLFKDKQTRELA